LPEVLYLQADNSAKDNKNFILIGFLASLVMRNVFRKVKLSFLMVGHTHEDVDQMFSRFALGLQKKAVTTLPVLQDHLKQAYSPESIVQHLSNIWDFRQLALDGQVQLSGHSVPHVFEISFKDNKVVISSKSWSLKSEQYTDLDVTGLASSFMEKEPEHSTAATSSKFADLLAKMGEDIPKWKWQGRNAIVIVTQTEADEENGFDVSYGPTLKSGTFINVKFDVKAKYKIDNSENQKPKAYKIRIKQEPKQTKTKTSTI
ncbi:hypothetical protein FSP39_019447, partial [Pinctada imbricata]